MADEAKSQPDPSNVKQCQFIVVRKNRICRQRAIKGCDYCGEHLLSSGQRHAEYTRIPCPLDSSHSCYEHQLKSHMKKCNAREKAWPSYLVKNINGEDPLPSVAGEKASVQSVSDHDLTAFIALIKRIFKDHVSPTMVHKGGPHPLISEELAKVEGCATLEKHLRQQGHLVQLLWEKGLVVKDQLFVEFGAGRGQLATWVMRALRDEGVRQSTFVLVDRGSQRYKADNRYVDEWGSFIQRIRADIRHLCLERLATFDTHNGRVVGFCKHLCGVATDLALRCITGTVGQAQLPRGLVMAVCCHHRCEWQWYVGRNWLEGLGLSDKDFELMVSIAGWATCGTGPRRTRTQRSNENGQLGNGELSMNSSTTNTQTIQAKTIAGELMNTAEEGIAPTIEDHSESSHAPDVAQGDPVSFGTTTTDDDNELHQSADGPQHPIGRYAAMGLSPEIRREIGYMVKAILDEGRLKYLRSLGMTAERVAFITPTYTPENFALVATAQTLS